MNKKGLITSILIIGISLLGYSQKPNQDILDLFGNEQVGIWVKHFQGTSDQLSNVILTLGNNEIVYRGFIKQGQSTKKVEGTYHRDSLKLLTINSIDEVDGFIEGTIRDSSILAVHFDQDHNRQFNFGRTL